MAGYKIIGASTTVEGGTPAAPGNVTLGTPKLDWTFKGGEWYAKITIPVTAPDPIGTFDRMIVFLQAPDDAVSTEKATISADIPGFFISADPNEASRIVSLSEPEAKVELKWNPEEPIISITHPEPKTSEQWRIIVVSASRYVTNPLNRADGDNPTPSVVLTVTPHPDNVSGAEVGPNVRNVTGEAKYRFRKGAQQLWHPKISWTLPTEDPRFAQLDFWDIYRFAPELADLEETPEDDRLALVSSVGAGETEWAGTDDWPVPDTPTGYKIYVRGSRRDGSANSIVDGVTGSVVIVVERQLIVPGKEAADVVQIISVEYAYVVSPATGKKTLEVTSRIIKPTNDKRYGSVVVHFYRSDFPEFGFRPATGSETGDVIVISTDVLPDAPIDYVLRFFSQDADGQTNEYLEDVTPQYGITIEPPAVAIPIPNVTGFSVTATYVEGHHGQKDLSLKAFFTAPDSAMFASIEFWARREDSQWYLLIETAISGTPVLISPPPKIGTDWTFKAVVQDVDSRNRDGDVDTNTASFPSGTPTFVLGILPPFAVTEATGFSVTFSYLGADYYGKETLRLTPAFTPPASDDTWAYEEFWHQRGAGEWSILSYPSASGNKEPGLIEKLPASTETFHFRLVAIDKDGRNALGQTVTDPAAFPPLAPSFDLDVPPPNSKIDGSKMQNIVVASFAAGFRPTAYGTSFPTATPNTDYPVGSEFWRTDENPPKLYRMASSGWTKEVDGGDLKQRSVAALSVVTGSLTTNELAVQEFLLGQGGGKPTRFKTVGVGGAMVAFMGDDPAIPFTGIFSSRFKAAPGILSTSPRVEITAFGALEIEGGTFELNLNGITTSVKNTFGGAIGTASALKVRNNSSGRQAQISDGALALLYNDSVSAVIISADTGSPSAGGVINLMNTSGSATVTLSGASGTVAANSFYVGFNQVVGPRQSAISSPSGGATIDTQARSAIDAIRYVLYTHGLTSP